MKPFGLLYFASKLVFFAFARAYLARSGIEVKDRLQPERGWIATGLSLLYFVAMSSFALVLYHLSNGATFRGVGLYGGDAVFVAMLPIYLAWTGLPRAPILDATALALPASMVVAKIACLTAGCCYGRPTSLPWAVIHSSKAVHPTQAYDALVFLTALFVVGIAMWKRRLVGQRLLMVLVIVGLGRTVTEFFRGDDRPSLGPVSTAQLTAALTALLASLTLLIPQARRAFSRLVPPDGGERYVEAAELAVACLRTRLAEQGDAALAFQGLPPRPRRTIVAIFGYALLLITAGLAVVPLLVVSLWVLKSPTPKGFRRELRIRSVRPWLWAPISMMLYAVLWVAVDRDRLGSEVLWASALGLFALLFVWTLLGRKVQST